MRTALSLAIGLAFVVVGCGDEPEPMSRIPIEAERNAAPAAERPPPAQPGVALAQPPRPPTPAPTPTVQTDDQRAPDTFAVRLDTTAGAIIIDVTRAWAPYGADRFYTLVREGYFVDVAFFRVVEGFMAQGGLHGDPAVNAIWRARSIPDDPVVQSNTRGMVTYAMAGPNTRSNQFFINLVDNNRLDGMGFAPFGRVRDMAPVSALHSGYGESAPRGRGPQQGRIQSEGNTYLRADFPELSYIRRASIL